MLNSLPSLSVICVVRAAVQEAGKHYEYFDQTDQDDYYEENKNEVAHQIKGLRHVQTDTHCTFMILAAVYMQLKSQQKLLQNSAVLWTAQRDEYEI